MELPHIGKHCHVKSCNQLDFLPMKCDACSNILCKDHIKYDSHSCQEAFRRDNQVPVCPLCNIPIPVKPGVAPDIEVGRHIDSDCQSDPAKERRKVYTNKCSHKGCKTKELIPVNCDKCKKNFCLKHRHESDHMCKGFEGTGRGMSNAGAAAISRVTSNNRQAPRKQPTQPKITQAWTSNASTRTQLQGNMSEDEAMARALAMSMNDAGQSGPVTSTQQEEIDRQLAQALAASEQEARRQNNRQNSQNREKSCRIS